MSMQLLSAQIGSIIGRANGQMKSFCLYSATVSKYCSVLHQCDHINVIFKIINIHPTS